MDFTRLHGILVYHDFHGTYRFRFLCFFLIVRSVLLLRFYLSALYGKLQFLLRSVSHRPLYLLRHLIGLLEADTPIQKEPELHLHGMDACLGNDETALWHDL